MEKIKKMVEAYNEKAKKWGYPTLSIENNKIVGTFEEKSTNSLSFIQKAKTIYRNGYLKEDFDKINKELNK